MSYIKVDLVELPQVADTIVKDETEYTVIATGTNVMLLYRHDRYGTYVVAQFPSIYDGELVWGQGHYYILCNEDGKVDTFRDAVEKFAAIDKDEKEWEARHNG